MVRSPVRALSIFAITPFVVSFHVGLYRRWLSSAVNSVHRLGYCRSVQSGGYAEVVGVTPCRRRSRSLDLPPQYLRVAHYMAALAHNVLLDLEPWRSRIEARDVQLAVPDGDRYVRGVGLLEPASRSCFDVKPSPLHPLVQVFDFREHQVDVHALPVFPPCSQYGSATYEQPGV
jgi:hypothetical protein